MAIFDPRIPSHFTGLYVNAVVNLLALCLTLVDAKIYVIDLKSNITVEGPDDSPAGFGPDIPNMGVDGLLMYGQPHNGCSPLQHPPAVNISDDLVWIALVSRSLNECSFARKVINAQKAGYGCVLVHNVGSDSLQTMGADEEEGRMVTIPSAFIGWENGLFMKRNYVYDEGKSLQEQFLIRLERGYPFDVNYYLLPFAIVVGICFVLMVIFMLGKWIRDVRKRRRGRLSKQHLKKLPVKKFKKGDNYDVCAICLDEYDEGDKLRLLPCTHAYHVKCVDPWLTNNKRTCPVCKQRVIPRDPESSESEQSDDEHAPSETTPLLPPPSGPTNSNRRSTFQNSGLPDTVQNDVSILSSSGSTEGPDSPQHVHRNSAYDTTDSEDEEYDVSVQPTKRSQETSVLSQSAESSRQDDETTGITEVVVLSEKQEAETSQMV